jgi:hypothetical protein
MPLVFSFEPPRFIVDELFASSVVQAVKNKHKQSNIDNNFFKIL